MTTTDPEHGTREWSEDPVGDLLKMYQTIKDAFEKITEDVKRFYEGLDDLTHTLLPLEKPGWAVHNKRRYRTRRVQPKLRLNAVPLGTGTYLYKAKEMLDPQRPIQPRRRANRRVNSVNIRSVSRRSGARPAMGTTRNAKNIV